MYCSRGLESNPAFFIQSRHVLWKVARVWSRASIGSVLLVCALLGASTSTAASEDNPGGTRQVFESSGTLSKRAPDYWQISSFNAANLDLFTPGNRAIWAGQTIAQQPGWATPPGYGNDWSTAIELRALVPDSSSPTTVQLQFTFNHDTEPGYDYFMVEYLAGSTWTTLAQFDGSNRDGSGVFQAAYFDESWAILPGDYVSSLCDSTGSEIALRLRVHSDGAWSDEDGAWDTLGAAQVDNISVRLNGILVSFADFEPQGSNGGWTNASLNRPPVCSAGLDHCIVNFGEPVVLDGSGSFDPDGTSISWKWDLGNGDIRFGEVVNYTYPEPGTYEVTLTVTDNSCSESSCTITVRICEDDKSVALGRVASPPFDGPLREGFGNAPAGQYYRRDLNMRRFRFRLNRETIGKAEWFAVAAVQPLVSLEKQVSMYPPTGGYERGLRDSKRKKKCDHDSDQSCSADPSEPLACRWKEVGGGINWLLYRDFALDGQFCDCLEVHVEWKELDKDFAEIAQAITSNLEFVEDCLGATSGDPASIVKCVVSALTSISEMVEEITDIPYDSVQDMGRFYTEVDGLSELICVPELPQCAGQTGAVTSRCDYGGVSTKGKIFDPLNRTRQSASVEFRTRVVCVGQGQSITTDACPAPNECTDPCELTAFEYGQISGSELRFSASVECANLRDPSAFIGTREFIFPIDVDNDPTSGDPTAPLCGADCYVSVKLVSDGTTISATRALYCWESDECCATDPSWVLQESLPYDVEVAEGKVSFKLAMGAIGSPVGAVSAWAMCRDGSGTVWSGLPSDPCADRLQLFRVADGECPEVEYVHTGDVEGGDAAAPIVVRFSEPIQQPSASDVAFSPSAEVLLSLDATGRELLITPVSSFAPSLYVCTLGPGILDLEGNPLRGETDDLGATCGTPVTFEFCVGNSGIYLSDESAQQTNEFDPGDAIYVAASGLATAASFVTVYVVSAEALEFTGQPLIDQTTTGPTVIPISGGDFARANVGAVSRQGDYALVIDLDSDGLLQRSDATISHCEPSVLVGDQCDDWVDGLVALWGFDDTASAAHTQDLHGGRVGYLHSSAQLLPGEGQVHGGLRVISGGYVEVASDDELDLLDDNFSVSVWVRMDEGSQLTVLDKRGELSGYELRIAASRVSITLEAMGDAHTYLSDGLLSVGQWTHVGVSVEREESPTLTIFLNGVTDSTHELEALSGSLANSDPLHIGRSRSQVEPGVLRIDELAFWDDALASEDMAWLYAVGLNGRPCPGETSVTSAPGLPNGPASSHVVLAPPYPNPFNPRTTVVVEIPTTEHVRITVHDARGRQVALLVESTLARGRHELVWDVVTGPGEILASGVYFLRVQSASGSSAAKLVLLK